MKEIKRLLQKNLFIFSIIVLLTLTGISCQGVSVPVQVTSANTSYAEFVQIRAAIMNYNQVQRSDASLYSSPSGARSINPQLQASDFEFYLYGQKKATDTSESFGPIQVYVTEDINESTHEKTGSGSFATQIPMGTWYLTLAAFKPGTAASSISNLSSSALLAGRTLADFTQSNPGVNFILSAAGLTTPGKVNLKINLQDWKLSDFDSSMKVKAELIKTNDNSSISSCVVEEMDKTQDTSLEYKPVTALDPGTYVFKLTFYNLTATTNSFTWSDKLIVYPGLSTVQDIYVPKVMNKAPEAPEKFKFEKDTTSVNDFSDYYPGTFTWKLPSTGTTATEYELKLYDEGENKVYFTYNSKNETSILCKAGSLKVPSTSITLWLPLGKNLSAQLCAKNQAGTSEPATTEVDETKTKIEDINLYRVTYNLQGGTTQDDKFGTDTTGQTGPFCYYGSVSSPHEWLNPVSENLKTSDGKIFDYWAVSPEDGAAKKDTSLNEGKYIGYENVELYAVYKEAATHPLDPAADQGDGKSLTITYDDYLNQKWDQDFPADKIISLPTSKEELAIAITTTGFIFTEMRLSVDSDYLFRYENTNSTNRVFIDEFLYYSENGDHAASIEVDFDNAETGIKETSRLDFTIRIVKNN